MATPILQNATTDQYLTVTSVEIAGVPIPHLCIVLAPGETLSVDGELAGTATFVWLEETREQMDARILRDIDTVLG